MSNPTPHAAARDPLRAPQQARPAHEARTMGDRRYWDRDRALIVGSIILVLTFPAAFFGLAAYLFLGVLMVPSVIALALILIKSRPWAFLTAGIVGSLFPLLALTFLGVLGGQLRNPLVGLEYSANVILLFSLVLLWAGTVSGFRRPRQTAPSHGPRPNSVPQLLVVLVAAGITMGAVATALAAENQAREHLTGGYDFVPPASVTVNSVDFVFSPRETMVTQGVITEFVVVNKDRESHTFTYEKDGRVYNHFLPRDSTVSFLTLFDTPGTVKYWCAPHSAGAADDGEGMVGTILVTTAS